MIKKLISLTLASVSTIALAGCGATDVPTVDTSVMGDGTSNKTGLGGYWWTYIDRSGTSSVTPDTGKKDPFNTTTKPPDLKASLGENNGLENGAFHVSGTVGVAPKYDRTDVYDPYWDGFYAENAPADYSPGVCGPQQSGSSCLEMKYPAVGIGFGFKASNMPLGADGAAAKGIAFKIKAGSGHPADKPVAVSMPMDLTDAPDPSYSDQFGTAFAGARPTGTPKEKTRNTPLCTFVGTVQTNDDGTPKLKSDNSPMVQGSTSKTCFANFSTAKNTKVDLKLTSDWKTYCLVWSDFVDPGFGGLGAVGIDKLDPTRITKMQFDAYKPDYAADAVPANFDFFVDDVTLLTEAKWASICDEGKGVIIPSAH